MPGDVGSLKYLLRQPFERAVETVCRSLADHGLRVAGQLDISRRVERALGIALPPCKVLFVLPNRSALSTDAMPLWAGILLPLHIVISGHEGQTEIQTQNRVQAGSEAAEKGCFGPLAEIQTQISEAIEAIAMRPSLVA